jgi:hypothetical protein
MRNAEENKGKSTLNAEHSVNAKLQHWALAHPAPGVLICCCF